MDTMDEKRKKVYKYMWMFYGGLIPSLIIPAFLVIGLPLIIYGGTKFFKTQKELNALYKDTFVKGPLQQNFENVTYNPEQGFDKETVRNFNLVRMSGIFSSEDYIRASYQGVNFEMAQVYVAHDSDNPSKSDICFKGRMMIFDFPDKVVSSVTIFSDTFKHRAFSDKDAKDNKVEFESAEFNRLFDVYSLSPHDAFYLITPQFMERLFSLQSKYNSIVVSAVGNRVIFGFNEPDNNAFDSKNLYVGTSNEDEMKKVQADIDDIKTIITTIRNIQSF